MTTPVTEFKATDDMNGVLIREPQRYEDARGWLMEFFRVDELDPALSPVMGYVSVTLPGVSRGPHEHRDQSDTLFFPGPGDFLVVLWDNRPGSVTHGRRLTLEAGQTHPVVVVVPPGVVHAYCCVSSQPGTVVNVPNRLYRGEGKRQQPDEIRHEDLTDSVFGVDFHRLLAERRQ